MKISLINLYENKPYYQIVDSKGMKYNALGFQQAKVFVEKAKSLGEKIEVNDIADLIEEHNKLVNLIKKQ